MPLHIDEHTFLKYWYHPSYLLDCTADKQTITNSLRSCKVLGIKTKNSTIIIDGGNLVPCGDKIVMTTKVFSENGVADYRILTEHGYEVTKMSFWGSPFNDTTWAYIHFLQVGDKIIMSKLRIPDDAVAKEHIKKAFPYCHIYQIDMGNIIDEGGALHCLTWNILKNF